MTTKNGLPCNSVISFIEDKENRWWLHTGCGVVQFPDSEFDVGGPTPKRSFRPVFTTSWMERGRQAGRPSMLRRTLRMGACGLRRDLW